MFDHPNFEENPYCSIRLVENQGRGLLSKTRISAGQLVYVEEPWAAVPDKSSSYCQICFVVNPSNRCSKCQSVYYCSRKCQSKDWAIHKITCSSHSNTSSSLHLIARTFVRRSLDWKEYQQRVLPLIDHYDKMPQRRMDVFAQMIVHLKEWIGERRLIYSAKESIKVICKVACNSFSIVNEEFESIGSGLFPVMSMINHHCAPNAIVSFKGCTAHLRAIRVIEKDEQIFVSYIDPLEYSAQVLQQGYFFTCQCESHDNELRLLKAQIKSLINEQNFESLIETIPEYLEKAERWMDENNSLLVCLGVDYFVASKSAALFDEHLSKAIVWSLRAEELLTMCHGESSELVARVKKLRSAVEMEIYAKKQMK